MIEPTKKQKQLAIVIYKLLRDAQLKIEPDGTGQWEIMYAARYLEQLLKLIGVPRERIRDLYTLSIDTRGYHINWKKTSLEEQVEELKESIPFLTEWWLQEEEGAEPSSS